MENFGQVLSPDTLRIERVLNAKPEKVWRHIVDADKRIRWFCGGDTIPDQPGAVFKMAFNHARITDEKPPEKYKRFDGTQPDYVATERVLAFEAPYMLKISFDSDEQKGTSSEVLFELKPEGDRTRLILTHSKLAKRADMIDVGGGWNAHLGVLEDEFAGRRNKDFWSEHARIVAALEKQVPK